MKHKVKTTYLELNHRNDFTPKSGYHEKIEIKEIEFDAYLNFTLFAGVGLPWSWYSRLSWSIDQWTNHFANHTVKTYLGFSENKLIGYYELEFQENNCVEIKFFGLLPQHINSGFGGKLLSHAIESAWSNDAKRVWLHTCSFDAEHAINNYLSRGFSIYKEEEGYEYIPEKSEMVKLVSDFYSKYIDQWGKKISESNG